MRYGFKNYNTLTWDKYHSLPKKHLEISEGIFDAPMAVAENRDTKH